MTRTSHLFREFKHQRTRAAEQRLHDQRVRGVQPICRRCEKTCKVFASSSGTFECFDFKERS